MRRKNLNLCDECKEIIGGVSAKAMRDTPKRILNCKGSYCSKCEKKKKENDKDNNSWKHEDRDDKYHNKCFGCDICFNFFIFVILSD